MKSIATLFGAALLCGALAAQAQTPPPSSPQATPSAPATKEQRPRLTPEQKEKLRADMKAAHEACKDSKDKRACMTENVCTKQADPAKCKERSAKMKERHAKHMDTRQEIAEACNGKRGDALQACKKAEMEKRGIKPGHHGHGMTEKKG